MTRESYLKKLIKENGLTIKDFAKKIHMPYSTLLTMLNEEKIGNASVDNVIKICRGLNITIQNLQNVLEADSANTQIVLSEHEKKLICHYREREELQKAVDILLLSDAKAIYR
ncbi:hypothetical protein C809_00679 [Lachnospiraceae bacterium MD335]|jgi:repressor LexA|nr:hypothetical protein C809_00679 [Lachnospiraceae bacterium MD335]